ncbi:MAG: hypothetical protein HKO65_14315 [Gemmatimonadetes bacterium]|nr:hypothetical protein [Gemmatimonadota bacterium]
MTPLSPFRKTSLFLRGGFVAGAVLGLGGCELTEVTLAEPEDELVAEAYIRVGDGTDQITTFLHWTIGTGSEEDLRNAEVKFFPEDGEVVSLLLTSPLDCLRVDDPGEVEGACYAPADVAEGVFLPGTRAEVEIRLPGGRELKGGTLIPNDIQLIRPAEPFVCGLPPGRHVEFVWNLSAGAWAYSAEAEINGLRQALAPQGIVVEEDSVSLLGFAVSEADTAIAFPKEFGIFNRFELQQEVAVALQGGLPEGSEGTVAVAALDRNYVNWVRGGNFNPSGAVRISSLRGDGIGVLASAVRRSVRAIGVSGPGIPSCLEGL